MHHPHHKHNLEDFAIGYLIGKSSAGSPQRQVSHDSSGWLGWAIFFTIASGLFALFVGPLVWPGGLDIFQTEPLYGIFILAIALIICGLPFFLIFGIIVALIDERKFDAEMVRQSLEHQQEIDRLKLENEKKQAMVAAKKAELRAMLEEEVDVESYLSVQVNLGRMTHVEHTFYSNWSNLERHYITIEKLQDFLKSMEQENSLNET